MKVYKKYSSASFEFASIEPGYTLYTSLGWRTNPKLIVQCWDKFFTGHLKAQREEREKKEREREKREEREKPILALLKIIAWEKLCLVCVCVCETCVGVRVGE